MRRNLELDAHPCVELIAQDLIDLMFTAVLAYREYQDGFFRGKSREEVAAWLRKKLKERGYPTEPRGISWGVLTK